MGFLRLRWAGLAVAAALLALHTSWCWREVVDDAYITYRYSRNAVEGNGFVWNPGESVEGITNLLWGLLLVPFAAGGEVVMVSKILGLLGLFGSLALSWDWGLRQKLSPAALVVLVAPMILLPWAPHNAVQGLETPAALFAVTLAWSRFEAGDRWPWWALGAAAAPLLRPDAAVVPAILLVATVLRVRTLRTFSRNDVVGWAIIGGTALATLAFKLGYYGEVLPNTFYVKKAEWPYITGWSYLGNFLFSHAMAFGPVVIGGLVLALWRAPSKIPAVVLGVYGLVVCVWTGGDFFANYRFVTPALPALGATWALALPTGGVGWAGMLVILAVCGWQTPILHVAGSQGWGSWGVFAGKTDMKVDFPPMDDPAWGKGWKTGNGLPPGFTLGLVPEGVEVAYTDIGALGYLVNNPIVDLYGLTDPRIAKQRFKEMAEGSKYVLDRCGVILIRTNAPQPFIKRVEAEAKKDPRFTLVLELEGMRAYATKEAWVQLPPERLEQRWEQLIKRMPWNWAQMRVTLEFAAMGSQDLRVEPLLAAMEAAGAPPKILAESRCWAGGECPKGKLNWNLGKKGLWNFVPPRGSDPAVAATYQRHLSAFTGQKPESKAAEGVEEEEVSEP